MNPICVHFSSMTVRLFWRLPWITVTDITVVKKSKLVLVGPDGYVTPHGAQLPINTAGFIIRSS
jgi:hypothetical protein